jgi:hypothetical protein
MADSELFLIAHKVRGELAFDVATPIKIGETDGWVIPTSGHRAYPLMSWAIDELGDVTDYHSVSILRELGPAQDHPMWPSLRDHYHSEPQSRVSKPAGKITSINLADLGL